MPRAEVQGRRGWQGRGSHGQEAGGWAWPPPAVAGAAGTHRLLPRVVALRLHLPAVPAPWATAILSRKGYRGGGRRRTQLAPGAGTAVAHRESV